MENRWKIWLGLIVAMTIVFVTEKHYFDLGFFEQTKIGFTHDLMVSLAVGIIWTMFGLLGFYKEKK